MPSNRSRPIPSEARDQLLLRRYYPQVLFMRLSLTRGRILKTALMAREEWI